MNPFRSSFAFAAACGLLLSAAGSALAGPKQYDITGTVTALTDTSMTLVTNRKENWDFARDTTTKAPDGMKVGDKIQVHYTMMAQNIDAKPADAAKSKKADKADKTTKKAKADATEPAAAASGSPSKPAAEAAAPTP